MCTVMGPSTWGRRHQRGPRGRKSSASGASSSVVGRSRWRGGGGEVGEGGRGQEVEGRGRGGEVEEDGRWRQGGGVAGQVRFEGGRAGLSEGTGGGRRSGGSRPDLAAWTISTAARRCPRPPCCIASEHLRAARGAAAATAMDGVVASCRRRCSVRALGTFGPLRPSSCALRPARRAGSPVGARRTPLHLPPSLPLLLLSLPRVGVPAWARAGPSHLSFPRLLLLLLLLSRAPPRPDLEPAAVPGAAPCPERRRGSRGRAGPRNSRGEAQTTSFFFFLCFCVWASSRLSPRASSSS